MNKALIAIALTAAITPAAQGARQVDPTVGDIAPYCYPQNATSKPEAITFMPDGKQYATISADMCRIVATDIASGAETVIFDVANTRETTIMGIQGFELSADASKILVWNSQESVYRRSFTACYYVFDRHSRILKPLSANHKRQQIPQFSPDSRMVAFVADNNIYVAKLDYGTEVAVTTDGAKNQVINGATDWTYEEEFTATSTLAWAPDNLTLCYLRFDESDVPTYNLPIYEGTCDPLTQYALYPGTFSYKYPEAGEANSRVSLHSYDIDTRKVKDLRLPDANIEYIPRIHYGPNENALMAVTLNRDQNRMEIYSVNPKSGVARSIYVEESNAWITPQAYEDITFGRDCFTVFNSHSGYTRLYQYSYAGQELRTLSPEGVDATEYCGSDAKGNHYYAVASPTPLDRTVQCLDAKGNRRTMLYNDGTTSATFNSDMQYALVQHSDAHTPPVYTLVNASGKTLRTLVDNAEYAKRYAAAPKREFFQMESDGYKLNGYIVKPAGFNPSKRYPVVMYQYSGPGSQNVLNRWEMDWWAYFAMQGYVVISVDGRGTGGRGREFSDIVYKRLGYYETIDQIAAARYASQLPYVDGSRIGIYGWSYGGYETLMAASADAAPFAAAVAVAPVTDWRYYDSVYTERYMLTPQQNFDGYNASSALRRSSQLQCPLLIMYGTADDNVHPANSLQYVSRLQSSGIMCDMFVFPNMNHSIYGCNARAVVFARMLKFFNEILNVAK